MKKAVRSLKRLLCFSLILTVLFSTLSVIQVFAATTTIADFRYPNTGVVVGNELSAYGDLTSGYSATGGVMQGSSRLLGSVNGSATRKVAWTDLNDILPAISGSSSNTWTTAGYFEVRTSTVGYQNISLSAAMSGSKQAPRDFTVLYSVNGGTFTSAGFTQFSFSTNKTITTAYSNRVLPSAVNNAADVRIRIKVNSNFVIAGTSSVYGNAGGDLGISYITLSGDPISGKLSVPTVNVPSGSSILHDDTIALSTVETGASIKYQIDNGTVQTYIGEFAPLLNSANSTVTVTAWVEKTGFTSSDKITLTYNYKADNLARFIYSDNTEPMFTKIDATKGIYENSKISASANGIDSFVPLYDTAGGIKIAPDDTLKWGLGGYWQFEISTAGYKDICMSANSFTSKTGPISASLKYSLDGINYTTLIQDKPFPINSIGAYYTDYQLPSEINNQGKVYIRFVFEQDKRSDPLDTAALFNNESRGNNYINNVVFYGTKDTTLAMPYTNKASDRFSLSKGIEYICPSGAVTKYDILDKDGNKIVDAATYTAPIVLSNLSQFNPANNNKFTINIWAENNGLKSIVNSRTFTYSGDTIAAFMIDPLDTASQTAIVGKTSLNATTGNGTLTMRPNGVNDVALDYSKSSIYAKAVPSPLPSASPAPAENAWKFDVTRTNPNSDGYWMIQTSTLGYKNISISADQLSTDKGPRDFCISYSTDGVNFTNLPSSKTKLNLNLTPTFKGFVLPDVLDNQPNVYIKIKLDGGETVSGLELNGSIDPTLIGTGNTGINNIEINGINMNAISDSISLNTTDTNLLTNKDYSINCSVATPDSIVVVAGYNNGMLVYIKKYSAAPTISFNIPQTCNATSVKIMMLSNTTTIKPLCENIVQNVSSN